MILKNITKISDTELILTNLFLGGVMSILLFVLFFQYFTFSWIHLILGIIILEVLYHSEKRTKKERKKGRNIWEVIGNKIDKAFDSYVILLLGTFLVYIGKLLVKNYEAVLKVTGITFLIIASISLWLYLNWLRDKPRRKKK